MPDALTIRLEDDALHLFPELTTGGFLVDGLDRAALALAGTAARWPEIQARLVEQGLHLQNLVEDRRIAGWREAVRRMGLKPSTYKSSPEQLARRALKDPAAMVFPLPAVGAYCAVSAETLAPLGGYDLDSLPGEVVALRLARPGSDTFAPLGGGGESMPLTATVAVYACGDQVICWALNHRDSRFTCLRPETRRAAFFSEGVGLDQAAAGRQALERLRDVLREAGAAPGPIVWLTAERPEDVLRLPEDPAGYTPGRS